MLPFILVLSLAAIPIRVEPPRNAPTCTAGKWTFITEPDGTLVPVRGVTCKPKPD